MEILGFNKSAILSACKKLVKLALVAVLLVSLQPPTAVFANDTSGFDVLTVDTSLNVEREELDVGADNDTPIEIPWVYHPITVTNEPLDGFHAIRKTYALNPGTNPAVIPTGDFEMFGRFFRLAFVLTQEATEEMSREVSETVQIELPNNNLENILAHLEPEIQFERDGYTGTLVLDIHSIRSEAAGTTRTTYTSTRTRTYPHLPTPDNALIPRTITESGRTFNLANVEWSSVSNSAVDGHAVAGNFTATATYTAPGTRTNVTGFTITAEYFGRVVRIAPGRTLYTAIFVSDDLVEPEDEIIEVEFIPAEPEPEEEPPVTPIREPIDYTLLMTILTIVGTLLALGTVGAGGFLLGKKMFGHHVVIFNQDGREYNRVAKMKLNLKAEEPVIALDSVAPKSKSERFVISVMPKATKVIAGKTVCVTMKGYEFEHDIPLASKGAQYEFEVDFSEATHEKEPAAV